MNRFRLFLKIIIGITFFFNSIAGISQNPTTSVQQKIEAWQTTPGLANAGIGVAITDNQTGEELVKSKPQLSLLPASIMKVVTTSTALEVFGPEFRFTTTLSYSGIIRNDTLFGNLQIVGGGDPTLGSMYFPEKKNFQDDWIKAIRNKHIRTIFGNLVVDATIYEQQSIPGSWVWDDIGNYYGAGASGLSVYDNLYEIHLSSGPEANQPAKIIGISPEIPNLVLQNEVLSSEVNSDQTNVTGSPTDSKRIIRGTIPKNKTDFAIKASAPDPAAFLASEFRKKLAYDSISITGETRFEKADAGNELFVTQSPALRDIISVTNHESVNLFAEHFLKHLAWQNSGLGATRDGCKFVIQFWKEKGLDLTGFYMNDGSGLSRFNAVTASQMVFILNYMKTKSAWSSDFIQSLASAGNGTLTVFKSETFPDQCLHAKSGSMTRVRCYAGYLTTISGRQLTFTFMLNNFSCSQAESIKKIEEVLLEMRKL